MRVSRVSPVASRVLSLLSSALLSVLTCISSVAEYLLTASAVFISGQFSLLPSSSEFRLKMRTAVFCLISVLLVSKIYQTTQEEYKKTKRYKHQSDAGSIEVYIEGTSLKFVLNNERGEGIHLIRIALKWEILMQHWLEHLELGYLNLWEPLNQVTIAIAMELWCASIGGMMPGLRYLSVRTRTASECPGLCLFLGWWRTAWVMS